LTRNLIRSACEKGSKPPRFLPHEGFVDELLFGANWWTTKVDMLNATVEHHEGLRFAKFRFEVNFAWPGTEVIDSQGSKASDASYQPTHPLFELGYNVQKGTSRQKRWNILTNEALQKLGLRVIANHIAMLCRHRKRQDLSARKAGRPQRYSHAIGEWEYDLAHLKKEYYDKRRGKGFVWPSTELRR